MIVLVNNKPVEAKLIRIYGAAYRKSIEGGTFFCERCRIRFSVAYGVYGNPSKLNVLEWYCKHCARILHVKEYIVG